MILYVMQIAMPKTYKLSETYSLLGTILHFPYTLTMILYVMQIAIPITYNANKHPYAVMPDSSHTNLPHLCPFHTFMTPFFFRNYVLHLGSHIPSIHSRASSPSPQTLWANQYRFPGTRRQPTSIGTG